MRRRWLVVLLALTACRQALGIPGSGSTSGDQVGFRVIAKVAGADGASGGTMVLVNDTVVPLTDGDMIKLEAPLDDGETFTVTSARPNCHITNGSGKIEGDDATGVEIDCDGLASLKTFGFSAPISFKPDFDPGNGMPQLEGSFLIQEAYFTPVATFPGAAITKVEVNGMAATPATAPFGPYAFTQTTSFAASLAGSGYTRDYLARSMMVPPGVFGYGKPSSNTEEAWFGDAVAAWGELLVVGAPNAGKGRAFVYRRTGTRWVEEQELTSSAVQDGDRFGASVAISGTTIVVGAPGSSTRAGAAYVFTESNGTWTVGTPLAATNAAPGDEFGAAVARSDPWTVIGAPGCKDTGNVVTGCVFEVNGPNPITQPLTFGVAGARAGSSIAISGTMIVAGAPGEASNAGAAYVITAPPTTTQRLHAGVPGVDDQFGAAVAIDGTTILVGAPLEDSNATGFDGDQTDNSAIGAGAAYLFTSAIATPIYIKAPNTGAGDSFGHSVGLRQATVNGTKTLVLAIGAPYEDSANDAMDDNSSRDAGAIYAFPGTFNASTPVFASAAYVKAANVESGDNLGASLALTTDTLVAGAPLEDASVTGWNGAANENSFDSGAVFTFR